MNRGDPNRYADRIVFWVCLIVALGFYTAAVHSHGYQAGIEAPKVCAVVPGKQVVSSTADTCTYASAFGRATSKRRAG